MSKCFTHRRAAGLAAAALALGIAAPAGARPFDLNAQGSYVPVNQEVNLRAGTPAQVAHLAGPGDLSLLDGALIGGGVGGIAVVGVGIGAGRRRRHSQTGARRSTLAA